MPLETSSGISNEISAQNRERIIQARKKRAQQLKKWQQYDKQVEKEASKTKKQRLIPPGGKAMVDVPDGARAVTFGESIILLDAATRDDHTEVRRLLTKGVSPDLANEDGLTPLHQCCIDNALNMSRLLLSFGANVNAKDSENWTPLHAAATCGHTELCKLLIDNKADLLALNAEGNMPYDICDHEATLDLIETEMASRGITQQQIDETRLLPEKTMLVDVQRLLQERPQAINDLDSQGAALLHIAAANGFYEVAQLLLSKGANLTVADKDGWLAIHLAACWGHLDLIELLVSYGADIEVRTKNGSGESVFDICEDGEMQERLRQIKRDAENLRHCPYRNIVRRSSSKNPRSASIRRTSVRDKSLTSRREAQQEAAIRLTMDSPAEPELATDASATGGPSFNNNHNSLPVSPLAQEDYSYSVDSKKQENTSPSRGVPVSQPPPQPRRPRPPGATSSATGASIPSMTSAQQPAQTSTRPPSGDITSVDHRGANAAQDRNKSREYVNLFSESSAPSATTGNNQQGGQRSSNTLTRSPGGGASATKPGPAGGTLTRNNPQQNRVATPVRNVSQPVGTATPATNNNNNGFVGPGTATNNASLLSAKSGQSQQQRPTKSSSSRRKCTIL